MTVESWNASSASGAAGQWLMRTRRRLSARGQAHRLGQAREPLMPMSVRATAWSRSDGGAVNRSVKGLKQSHGLMGNDLDDLDRIERHPEAFTQGEIASACAVSRRL